MLTHSTIPRIYSQCYPMFDHLTHLQQQRLCFSGPTLYPAATVVAISRPYAFPEFLVHSKYLFLLIYMLLWIIYMAYFMENFNNWHCAYRVRRVHMTIQLNDVWWYLKVMLWCLTNKLRKQLLLTLIDSVHQWCERIVNLSFKHVFPIEYRQLGCCNSGGLSDSLGVLLRIPGI